MTSTICVAYPSCDSRCNCYTSRSTMVKSISQTAAVLFFLSLLVHYSDAVTCAAGECSAHFIASLIYRTFIYIFASFCIWRIFHSDFSVNSPFVYRHILHHRKCCRVHSMPCGYMVDYCSYTEFSWLTFPNLHCMRSWILS